MSPHDLLPPLKENKMMVRCLNFCKQEQVRAGEMAKFGQDSNLCHYKFMDARVSRIQFSLQLYRKLNSTELCFEIKNMSKKTKLIVDHTELGYLNKIDLPWKCIICFGDYQILAETQEGESMDYFETHTWLRHPSYKKDTCHHCNLYQRMAFLLPCFLPTAKAPQKLMKTSHASGEKEAG